MSDVVKKDPKAFYGPGGTLKERKRIPAPGVIVNGKILVGTVQVTYDQYANAMSMLSNRIQHELTQRLGRKDAQIVIGLGAASRANELF